MKCGKWLAIFCLSLAVILLVASFAVARDKDGRKSALMKATEATGIPGPLVVNIGATGTLVGYTGLVGDNTTPHPAFPYTWPENDYLYWGQFRYLGKIDGVLYTEGTRINRAPVDTFFWTSSRFDPNAISEFDTRAQWGADGLKLEVIQRTYAWSESYRDDFIVWDFTLRNYGDKPLEGLFMAQWMDCDVSMFGGDNHWLDDLPGFYGYYNGQFFVPTRWTKELAYTTPEDSIYISYMWDDDAPWIPGDDTGGWKTPKESLGFIGTISIDAPKPAEGNFGRRMPSGHSWWDWNSDPVTPEDIYSYMRWGINNPDAPYREVPSSPFDYRYMISWGPYNLNPGDSVRIVCATGLGIGLEGLVKNLKTAKELYDNNWVGYAAPPPPATFTAVPGFNRVDLSWSSEPETETRDPVTGQNDFEGYKLWKSEDGGATWSLLAQFDIINDVGLNTGIRHEFTDFSVQTGFDYVYAITSYDRGDPSIGLEPLESGRAAKQITVRPGTPPQEVTKKTMDDIYVAPNPYKAYAPWNREIMDPTIPRENRIGFFNLPKKCTIKIFTLAGDLVDTIEKDDESGEAYWDSISRSVIEVVSGVYLYVVESDKGKKVGKFAIIK